MSSVNQIKNHWQEKQLFGNRLIICIALAIVLTGIVMTRLVVLQFVDASYYSAQSQGNRIRVQPLPPTRGLIFDRNQQVLAENTPSYQLEITPEQVPDLDDTLARLTAIGLLTPDSAERALGLIRSKRRFDSIPVRQRLSDDEVARFAVQRPYFPGVEIRARLARTYPYGTAAAHALGYVGGISADDMQTLDQAAYAGTGYIGKVSVERHYEAQLHGGVGRQDVLVNVHGRVMQVLDTTLSVPGSDLDLTLDMSAQLAAEAALGDRRGAVVALDPNNGEILVLASTPSFDPNKFISGLSQAEFNSLQNHVDQPLFNRALRGRYPPGSTIKPLFGLTGLEEGAIRPSESLYCRGWYSLPGNSHRYRDWKREGHGAMNLHDAIAQSCDVYFYELATELGIDTMSAGLQAFGLGTVTGVDIGPESAGLVPSRDWKRRNFSARADQVWFPGETVITGIGQGYLLTTPLQLAHITATIAMRGQRYRPMLVRAIHDAVDGTVSEVLPESLPPVSVRDPAHWDEIIEAMRGVIYDPRGTARAIGTDAPWAIAGKSGTAQVFSIAQDARYDEEDVAERMRDHALFVAFAPIEKPRIAVAVIVENGGSGSGVAAPVARAVMDAYLGEGAPGER